MGFTNISSTDNFSYEKSRGAWVVWDNDERTAAMLKQMYPEQAVVLFDPKTQKYTQYFIEVQDKSFTWLGSTMNVIEGTKKI